MKAVMLMMLCVLGAWEPNDWTPVVATEGATVTLSRRTPAPLPKPDPDGAGAAGQSVTGPLDTLRDAKELIRKGNDLADQSVAILDQARRDGKITVDIRLPQGQVIETPTPRNTCPGGVCSHRPTSVTSSTTDEVTVGPTPRNAGKSARQVCQGGARRSHLFWRFRR